MARTSVDQNYVLTSQEKQQRRRYLLGRLLR